MSGRPDVSGAHVRLHILQRHKGSEDEGRVCRHSPDDVADVFWSVLVVGLVGAPLAGGVVQRHVALQEPSHAVHRVRMYSLLHGTSIAGDGGQLHHSRVSARHLLQQGPTSGAEGIQRADHGRAQVQLQVGSPIAVLYLAEQVVSAQAFRLVGASQDVLSQGITILSAQHPAQHDIALRTQLLRECRSIIGGGCHDEGVSAASWGGDRAQGG
mmetsp:Transcript_76937/g.220344  ORF Transcript_76937/g.220344 Transcript_76937/m.220344 type:complete len:212 (-) Transcript_76937:9-644(-)